MAIDYFGLFPCKVRSLISNDELLAKIKARNRANTAHELVRKNPHPSYSDSEEEWTISIAKMTPDGIEEQVVRIHDMLHEAEPLTAMSAHCVDCPENVRGDEFGCGGAIHYPISAQAEHWLMSRLPADIHSRRGALLMHAIADLGCDGLAVDENRTRNGFSQLPSSIERQWGKMFAKKTRIRSSQILQMLFFSGSFRASHANMIAYIFGFIGNNFDLATDSSVYPESEDDSVILELKLFFRVSALAGERIAPVYIDA